MDEYSFFKVNLYPCFFCVFVTTPPSLIQYCTIVVCVIFMVFVWAPKHTHTHTHTHKGSGSTHSLKWRCTGWRRSIGCLILIGHFRRKSPIISGSCAERDLQLEYTHKRPATTPATWLHPLPLKRWWVYSSCLPSKRNGVATISKLGLFCRISSLL